MKKYYSLILLTLLTFIGFISIYFIFTQSRVVINFNNEIPIPFYHWKNKNKVIRVAMISILNRKDTLNNQLQLIEALGNQLGEKTLLIYRNSYNEIIQLIKDKKVDIAILSTGSYILHKKDTNITLLAMQEREGHRYYNGYIIVPKNSPAKNLADLKGKNFLYTDPNSYSGYLSVIQKLDKDHYDPNTFFKHTSFTYSHDYSLREIALNRADAAAVDSYVYDYLRYKEPNLIKKIKILIKLPKAGTGPVVVRSDLPTKEILKIKNAFLSLKNTEKGRKAMNSLLIDNFVSTSDKYYPHIENKGIIINE